MCVVDSRCQVMAILWSSSFEMWCGFSQNTRLPFGGSAVGTVLTRESVQSFVGRSKSYKFLSLEKLCYSWFYARLRNSFHVLCFFVSSYISGMKSAAILPSAVPLALPCFSTLSHNTIFGKNVAEHKMHISISSTTLMWNISHSKKNAARCFRKCENAFT